VTEPVDLTLAEARARLDKKELSATELTQAHLDAMAAADPLNAYVLATPDKALAMARVADDAIASGQSKPLTGIPIAVKDLFCTEGVRTTAASRILDTFIPPYEATTTANLWAAGAVMLGKTNLDEFAMGSSNEHSAFGPVKNPWRLDDGIDRVAGGSSGGSAAAVAARLALGATGTDTGGSIRQPASLTGCVGVKPSYGRCSRWGVIAFASSLDHPGPFARTVKDAAILLASMAGYDPKDSTSVDRPVPDYAAAITGDVRGLKIGVPQEYRVDGMPQEIETLWALGIDWLKAAGAEVRDISLPMTKMALPAYYIIAPAEASSNLARYDGVRYGHREQPEGGGLIDMYEATRGQGFGAEVQRRIMIGTYVLSAGYYDAYYLKAQKVRTLIAQDFARAFGEVDAILTPTAPEAAFPIGAKTSDPIAMYLNDVFTVPADLAGIPALSLPAGLSAQGLPLGLQVITRAFDEETMFRVGGVLEEAAHFTARPQPWWRG